MIVYPRKLLVGRIATWALLSSKRHTGHVTPQAATHSSVLDHMLAPEELQKLPNVRWTHIRAPVESTQDEARRLLREPTHDGTSSPPPYLAVLADAQLRGRGTRGRRWEGSNGENATTVGNLYLTVCIPLEDVPVTVTLLPLQIAVLVAERAARVLGRCRAAPEAASGDATAAAAPIVTVKWPNDVLVDGRKLSGTLIESETVGDGRTWFLIGIGVNVAFAPDLTRSPGKAVRAATCLQEYCCGLGDNGRLPRDTATYLASDLVGGLVHWIRDPSDRAQKERRVIDAWRSFAEFGQQFEVRGEVEDEDRGAYRGEIVTMLDIRNDGQLVVRGADGRERTLIADYLF